MRSSTLLLLLVAVLCVFVSSPVFASDYEISDDGFVSSYEGAQVDDAGNDYSSYAALDEADDYSQYAGLDEASYGDDASVAHVDDADAEVDDAAPASNSDSDSSNANTNTESTPSNEDSTPAAEVDDATDGSCSTGFLVLNVGLSVGGSCQYADSCWRGHGIPTNNPQCGGYGPRFGCCLQIVNNALPYSPSDPNQFNQAKQQYSQSINGYDAEPFVQQQLIGQANANAIMLYANYRPWAPFVERRYIHDLYWNRPIVYRGFDRFSYNRGWDHHDNHEFRDYNRIGAIDNRIAREQVHDAIRRQEFRQEVHQARQEAVRQEVRQEVHQARQEAARQEARQEIHQQVRAAERANVAEHMHNRH